jgi:hypothetical protein
MVAMSVSLFTRIPAAADSDTTAEYAPAMQGTLLTLSANSLACATALATDAMEGFGTGEESAVYCEPFHGGDLE